jgi:protease-4
MLGIFAIVALVGLGFIGGFFAPKFKTRESAAIPLHEVTIGGKAGAPKIACINVEGMIHGTAISGQKPTPVALATAKLKRAAEDDKVRGVVLFINSPGGSITGSDILHNEISKFRNGPDGKPVVACFLDMGTSGAYYIAAAADQIIALPTSITGSIGVMMPMYNLVELMDKIGIKNKSLTTGPFKDMGSPVAEKTEEQQQAERELLRNILNNMHSRFMDIVSEGRGLAMEHVRSLADGRIFDSKQALEEHLIDKIGYEEDAIRSLEKIAGIKNSHLIRYKRTISLGEALTTRLFGKNTIELNLKSNWQSSDITTFGYLWLPPE